jgi:hypothetical protein
MNATLRLLIPEKKGIRKRIEAVMKEGGVEVVEFRIRKELQGIRDAETEIVYANETLLPFVLSQLGRMPGVALLSLVGLKPPAPPSL